MNELVAETRSALRFATLLAEGPCLRPVYDEILMEANDCVVSPTLGSILPNWLLLVPRVAAVNFARFSATSGVQPSELIRSVLKRWRITEDRAIWFEHGASEVGSTLGCGIDQAHLHLIIDAPFSFDLFAYEVSKSADV